jgi:hypothetical protein
MEGISKSKMILLELLDFFLETAISDKKVLNFF